MTMVANSDCFVLLTGLTLRGPDIITQYPEISLSNEMRLSIAMKSLPYGGQCGDIVNVTLNGYQMIFVLLSVPAFEVGLDQRETTVSMGILMNAEINPLPYQRALKNIAASCKEYKILNIHSLETIMKELYKTIINDKANRFTITIEGTKIDFFLDEGLTQKNQLADNEISSTSQIIPVLTKEEILERESNIFIVDKFVLSTISNEFPITIENIWKKSLKLEAMIGSRLELNTIIEICKKYIEQGIIRKT